jgi:hypothetical protein
MKREEFFSCNGVSYVASLEYRAYNYYTTKSEYRELVKYIRVYCRAPDKWNRKIVFKYKRNPKCLRKLCQVFSASREPTSHLLWLVTHPPVAQTSN